MSSPISVVILKLYSRLVSDSSSKNFDFIRNEVGGHLSPAAVGPCCFVVSNVGVVNLISFVVYSDYPSWFSFVSFNHSFKTIRHLNVWE